MIPLRVALLLVLAIGVRMPVYAQACDYYASPAGTGNGQAYGATNTLFEDVAGFGSGRYQFLNFQSTATVVRRGWFRWEKSNDGSPKCLWSSAIRDVWEDGVAWTE